MPEIRHRKKVTLMAARQLLSLLRDDIYLVDPTTAEVSGPRGIVTPFYDTDGRAFVRLYSNRGKLTRKAMCVSKLQWMARTGSAVPKGFEVHHRDGDFRNNDWDNLLCLHRLDHRKMHEAEGVDEAPF